MKKSILKSIGVKARMLYAGVVLSLITVPSMAASWYTTHIPPPAVTIWDCPFPQPHGAYDWADFSPFSSSAAILSLPTASSLTAPVSYSFNWDNGKAWSSLHRVEVPPMATASLGGYGVGNVAVVQALYAVYLNRHTPYSDAGYLLLVAAGDPLYEDMELAMYSDYYMEKVVHRIAHATGIENDNLSGSIDQLAAGLQVGSNFFLPCSSGNFLAGRSSQIYTSTGFMGNIDVSGFTNLLLDGTVMIVQTNKLVWNSSRHAWNYGDDGIYLVKSVNRFITISGTTYNYALYDVATGATKVVSPQNGAIRNIWSTGSISGLHTVAILDDGDPDYTEVITGFAGLDPLVNYF